MLRHGLPQRLVVALQQLDVLAQVLPDAERPPGPGQHDHAHRRVVGHLPQRREQQLLGRGVQGVHGVGPVERDRRDAAADVQQHGGGRCLDGGGDVVLLGHAAQLLVWGSGERQLSTNVRASGSSDAAVVSNDTAARRPGQSAGSTSSGSPGSRKRNLRHSWTSRLRTAKPRSGVEVLLEARRELLRPRQRNSPVGRREAVQVPQLGRQRGARLGVAGEELRGCPLPRRPATAPARRWRAGRSTCPAPAGRSRGSPSRRRSGRARPGRRRARPRRRARCRPTAGRRCGRCGCAPRRAGPGRGPSRRSPAGPAARPARAIPRGPSGRRRCGPPAARRPRRRAAARSRRWAPIHRAATGGRRTGRTTLIGHARPIV